MHRDRHRAGGEEGSALPWSAPSAITRQGQRRATSGIATGTSARATRQARLGLRIAEEVGDAAQCGHGAGGDPERGLTDIEQVEQRDHRARRSARAPTPPISPPRALEPRRWRSPAAGDPEGGPGGIDAATRAINQSHAEGHHHRVRAGAPRSPRRSGQSAACAARACCWSSIRVSPSRNQAPPPGPVGRRWPRRRDRTGHSPPARRWVARSAIGARRSARRWSPFATCHHPVNPRRSPVATAVRHTPGPHQAPGAGSAR